RVVETRFQGWIRGAAEMLPRALELAGAAREQAFVLKEASEQGGSASISAAAPSGMGPWRSFAGGSTATARSEIQPYDVVHAAAFPQGEPGFRDLRPIDPLDDGRAHRDHRLGCEALGDERVQHARPAFHHESVDAFCKEPGEHPAKIEPAFPGRHGEKA